jgi:hypothetical protein
LLAFECDDTNKRSVEICTEEPFVGAFDVSDGALKRRKRCGPQ